MKDYTQGFIDELSRAFSKIGYTDQKTGYLGRGDGTTVVVDPDYTIERRVFVYEKHGDRNLPYFSAILLDSAGIYYEDSATNQDCPVRLAKPPGSNEMHVIGIAGGEAYNSRAGQTPLELRIGAGGGGGAPTTASYITKVAEAGLSNEFAMSSLATGVVKNTTGTGVPSIAAGSDLNTTFGSQTQNFVYAAPSGGAGNPSFRLLAAGDIPALDTSKITTGILGVARGGTGADLSGTGGANRFVKQSSVGAVLTVSGIVSADLTTALTTPPNIGGTTPADGTFNFLTAKSSIFNDGTAGTYRVLWYRTGTTARWALSANDTAEGGSNAGSDFVLRAYDDAGTPASFTALTVTRATSASVLKAMDATSAAVLDILTIRRSLSSGTPGAGFGAGIRFQAQDSTTDDQNLGRTIYDWAIATHASRIAERQDTVYDSGTERVMIDTVPTGVAMVGSCAINRAPSWNQTIPANYGMVVPYLYDVPAGVTVDVAAGGVLEVT